MASDFGQDRILQGFLQFGGGWARGARGRLGAEICVSEADLGCCGRDVSRRSRIWPQNFQAIFGQPFLPSEGWGEDLAERDGKEFTKECSKVCSISLRHFLNFAQDS